MESILTSVKKMLGIAEEYDHFDPDIITHINSVFMTLTQLGVGPAEGFIIVDKSACWTDFVPEVLKLQAVKSFMHLKVKLLFDPPTSSALIEAMNRQASEFEWRLNVSAESKEQKETL